MKDQALVSICTPIYNCAEFIAKSCKSLFGQTYTNIEYVFVDDCCTDDSLDVLNKVLDGYPNRKPSVKIISHEKNRGVSVARNTALKNATGEFLMWVDSDDSLDVSAVEKLVNLQRLTGSDLLTFDSIYQLPSQNIEFKNSDATSNIEFIRNLFDRKTNFTVWGRLFKNSIIKEFNLSFIEGRNAGEDLLFVLKYSVHSRSFANLHEFLYFYNKQNENSLTNQYSVNKSNQLILNMEDCKSVLKECGLFENCAASYNCRLVKMYNRMLLGAAKNNSDKDFFFSIQKKCQEASMQDAVKRVPTLYRPLFSFRSLSVAHCYVSFAMGIKKLLVCLKVVRPSYR